MDRFKKLAVSGALALAAAASAPAQASPITVDGVTWDPANVIDFSAFSVNMDQFIDPNTGVLSGYGIATSINGSTSFCTGCELTFQFGGYTPTGSVIPTTVGQSIDYSGGWLKIYVDFTPDAPATDPTLLTAANTGADAGTSLWLDLTGHGIFTGTVTPDGLSGIGNLDVVGGAAAPHFDTNTKFDGSDFAFSSSFTTFPNNNYLTAYGTGNLKGDSIPEPASIALVGAGLLGMGAVSKRRRKSA